MIPSRMPWKNACSWIIRQTQQEFYCFGYRTTESRQVWRYLGRFGFADAQGLAEVGVDGVVGLALAFRRLDPRAHDRLLLVSAIMPTS